SKTLEAVYATICVQCAQRRASIGISLKHSPHFFVVGSAGAGAFRIRATKALTGVTTKKYTAAAIKRNESSAFRKLPTLNTPAPTVNTTAEKSGLPIIAAISGA